MALYYDLHIHSCLSPCAEEEMTPGNICGMAHIKGLDLIAITDHNSALNLRAGAAMAERFGLLFVPGIEICTREEVHVLAYFETVGAAEEMGLFLRGLLPPVPNRPDFFGRQQIVDENDGVTGEESALLIGACGLSFSETCRKVRSLSGVPVPAHIYRGNGVVKMLGFIPKEDQITSVELKGNEPEPPGYRLLRSSDAHRLADIQERLHALEAEKTVPGVLDFLRRG